MCHDNGGCGECKETFKWKLQVEMEAYKKSQIKDLPSSS